jgi:hypothetical protein
VVTAFEIFEHLLNPYTILSEINQQDFHINTNAFVVSPATEVKQTCGTLP